MPARRAARARTARGELDAAGVGRATSRRAAAATRECESRFLLSTFGLLSPGKGIETMLDALPAIVERHPKALYVVAGRTHPQVARRERRGVPPDCSSGDRRPRSRRPCRLDDRFLDIDELADLLAATDVFVTPYREQRADRIRRAHVRARRGLRGRSRPRTGTRATCSPPVPASSSASFGDCGGSAPACLRVTSRSPSALAAARARRRASAGARPGQPSPRRPRPSCAKRPAGRTPARSDPRRRACNSRRPHRPPADARRRLGIIQHANGVDSQPRHRLLRRRRGAPRDRRARARASRQGSSAWTAILLPGARVPPRTRPTTRQGMRNFMSYDRRWLDEAHVGDHVGRAIWALGEVLSTAWVPALVGPARQPARHSRRVARERRARCARLHTRRSASHASMPTASTSGPRGARSLRRRRSSIRTLADRGRRLARGSRTRSGMTTHDSHTR